MTGPLADTTRITRRAWISSAAVLATAPAIARGGLDDGDDAAIAAIRDEGIKAGLPAFSVSRNEQFFAVGDAPQAFRERALEILQGLARDFLKHFTEKGFAVARPAGRMAVIVLSGRSAFESFLGAKPGEAVGGVYDLATNRLAIFDNRGGGAPVPAERLNTIVLFHEATHQLCFNTGLLDRNADIPLAVAEGLGTYGEIRGIGGKPKFGDMNPHRLGALLHDAQGRKARRVLSPCLDWVAQDEPLIAPESRQFAYSEAWLLVHYLMKTPDRLREFRSYLSAMKDQRDPKLRMSTWVQHLGDTAKLDRDLAAYLRRIG